MQFLRRLRDKTETADGNLPPRFKWLSLEVFSNHFWIDLVTRRRGKFVGTDHMGNRYYEDKAPNWPRKRRWVVYAGVPEASRVPPKWHAWLHYMEDEPPGVDAGKPVYRWEKEHKPNETGTEAAYLPAGHTLMGSRRDRASGDYEAWTPGT